MSINFHLFDFDSIHNRSIFCASFVNVPFYTVGFSSLFRDIEIMLMKRMNWKLNVFMFNKHFINLNDTILIFYLIYLELLVQWMFCLLELLSFGSLGLELLSYIPNIIMSVFKFFIHQYFPSISTQFYCTE